MPERKKEYIVEEPSKGFFGGYREKARIREK